MVDGVGLRQRESDFVTVIRGPVTITEQEDGTIDVYIGPPVLVDDVANKHKVRVVIVDQILDELALTGSFIRELTATRSRAYRATLTHNVIDGAYVSQNHVDDLAVGDRNWIMRSSAWSTEGGVFT